MIIDWINSTKIDFATSLFNKLWKHIDAVTIDYRLALEYPFPYAIIDCLAAASCISDNFKCILHIGSILVIRNLATVITLECYKKYKGRILSVCIQYDMFDPLADSLNYALNSTSSGYSPIEFLRWYWYAYLQLGRITV